MNFFITETKQTYQRKPGTKTAWIPTKGESRLVDEEQWRRVEESAPFFRRAGGSETVQREYTMLGYRAWRIISVSPDRQTKIVRTYSVEKTGE